MATLYGRAGDPKALRALAAAQLSTADVAFTAVADVADVRAKGGANPFGTNVIALATKGGAVLTDAGAIVKYLGGWVGGLARWRPGGQRCGGLHVSGGEKASWVQVVEGGCRPLPSGGGETWRRHASCQLPHARGNPDAGTPPGPCGLT